MFSNGQLALLIDGIDEHEDSAACARAIDLMLEHHTGLAVVVTYQATDAQDSGRGEKELSDTLAGSTP